MRLRKEAIRLNVTPRRARIKPEATTFGTVAPQRCKSASYTMRSSKDPRGIVRVGTGVVDSAGEAAGGVFAAGGTIGAHAGGVVSTRAGRTGAVCPVGEAAFAIPARVAGDNMPPRLATVFFVSLSTPLNLLS